MLDTAASTVMLLTTLWTPLTSVMSLVTRAFSASFLAWPLTVTTPSLVDAGHGCINRHVVDHALDTVNVGDELGDESLFRFVPGLATHRYHAIVSRDLGAEHAGRAMRQQ